MNQHSDILIIGAGPGGYETAAAAARKRLKVTLIERGQLGGTCLNRGCIPTKALAHAADVARTAREASACGVEVDEVLIDYAAVSRYRDNVVSRLREGVAAVLAGVEVVKGTARFVDSRTVAVGDDTFTADKIIIATGSSPAMLPIKGAEFTADSDRLLSMTSLPASMVIIGGGVIGMEFASIFNTLGVKVTVVEYCKEILPQFDKDIAKRLRLALTEAGISFVTGAAVTETDGRLVTYTKGDETLTVEGDIVAMAVGRRPNIPEGLEAAGVEYDRRGIKVDPQTMATTAEGIYAIGDVNGLCMLAHAATAQGRRVLGEEVNLDIVPSVVFTHPEAAMVGLTDTRCKELGIAAKSSKSLFRANGKAVTMGEDGGLVKLTYDPATKAILGCSILGPHAADLIQEITVAMAAGLNADQLSSVIHPHPTLSETLLSAATL